MTVRRAGLGAHGVVLAPRVATLTSKDDKDGKDGKDGAELVTSAAASGLKQPYGNHHALQGQA